MSRKSFLTTFDVSEICEVNPTTVQNWVKEGKLRAHTTPGGHRRIRREDLILFLKEYGMPIPVKLEEPLPYVLIVDDEPDMREILGEVLQTGEVELEVATAQNGVDALLMIGERKPDLLILDILMPGMNGLEVCRKLKSGAATRGLKIIAITGDHAPELRARVLTMGADLFFTKPFDLIEFAAACIHLITAAKLR
jgi:excisionase family DNA binding protein